MIDIDFLKIKTIIGYIVFCGAILILGAIAKDLIAIGWALVIVFYAVTNNGFKTLESFFIWFFLYGFFVGQEYFSSRIVSDYISKPTYLVFIIFICFIQQIPFKLFKTKFMVTWILFTCTSVVGTIIQGQSPLSITSWSLFFIFFFIVQRKGILPWQHNKILNLFVAVGIIQSIVSLLQVSQMIAPSTTMMPNGYGGYYKWVAGLDDVACGTFGPVSSHIVSWYAALISLLLVLTWSLTKKRKYIIVAAMVFLQFATVDSKTILATAIVMLAYTLYYIAKNRNLFKINILRYVKITVFMAIGAFGFYVALDYYYHYFAEKRKSNTRAGISAVYNNMVKESNQTIINNLGDWGKIRGYQYICEDFIKNDLRQLIWGYGLKGYTYNGKRYYIESLDTQAMKLNNFTRSRSGLITTFAKTGVIGFFLYCLAFIQWYKYNTTAIQIQVRQEIISMSLLKIFLGFSVLASFLYGITFDSIPLVIFASIVSIFSSLSKIEIRELSFHEIVLPKKLEHIETADYT